jgi:hypothetical protein
VRRHAAWLAAALIAAPASAAPRQNVVAAFSALQDAPPLTPDQLVERAKADEDLATAERLLNEWKRCVVGALDRWAPLHHGPALLIDGAFGRCADVERAYRDALTLVTQDGRRPIDTALARNLTQMLRDSWRARLTAMALDRELVALTPTPPAPIPTPIGNPQAQ